MEEAFFVVVFIYKYILLLLLLRFFFFFEGKAKSYFAFLESVITVGF